MTEQIKEIPCRCGAMAEVASPEDYQWLTGTMIKCGNCGKEIRHMLSIEKAVIEWGRL